MTRPIDRFATRRDALKILAGLGVGSLALQRALAQQASEGFAITLEGVRQAEWVADLELTDPQREEIVQALAQVAETTRKLHQVPVDYATPPAFQFRTLPQGTPPDAEAPLRPKGWATSGETSRPGRDEDLAFLSVRELAGLLRRKKTTSVELTKLSIARLKQYDPALLCVITLLEDAAMAQAERADRELAEGLDRGPLHGIPWGAKDLMAVPGARTTWGAGHYREQTLTEYATVGERLEEAGAVLVAKLSLGALAMGDRWYGGQTRNPWNAAQGSSGSSAGSAAAVVAGLVPFAIGSETLGSIVSPCRRCGATGLRPTFGRVSRHGCMPLAWTMDKIGPIAREADDCAVVFAAIHGADGRDPSAVTKPFQWPPERAELSGLRIGYPQEGKKPEERDDLRPFLDLGAAFVPMALPTDLPLSAMTTILDVEAAASFEQPTREGVSKGLGAWPATLRRARFVPAVDYVHAQRLRTKLMQQMQALFDKVDLYVADDDLVHSNLSGHPSVVFPAAGKKREEGQAPPTLTLTGPWFGEETLLAAAVAYQQATSVHRERPPLEKLLELP
ncbi:MAG TPA: amidase [Pirellulaceae bacterium]|jgi:Asp-tRNA(Asn)/Glu-tRNA(Gln) amidotransferase A subunit family amidase|nr:amidase [Pirellulaceae bacterium]